MPDPIKREKLLKGLNDYNIYDGQTDEDFVNDFKSVEDRKALFEELGKRDMLSSKSFEEFDQKYFGDVKTKELDTKKKSTAKQLEEVGSKDSKPLFSDVKETIDYLLSNADEHEKVKDQINATPIKETPTTTPLGVNDVKDAFDFEKQAKIAEMQDKGPIHPTILELQKDYKEEKTTVEKITDLNKEFANSPKIETLNDMFLAGELDKKVYLELWEKENQAYKANVEKLKQDERKVNVLAQASPEAQNLYLTQEKGMKDLQNLTEKLVKEDFNEKQMEAAGGPNTWETSQNKAYDLLRQKLDKFDEVSGGKYTEAWIKQYRRDAKANNLEDKFVEEQVKGFQSQYDKYEKEYQTNLSKKAGRSGAISGYIEATLDEMTDLSKTQKSAMRTYLYQKAMAQPKVEAIEAKTNAVMKSLGLPTPEELALGSRGVADKMSSDIAKANDEYSKEVAMYTTKVEVLGKTLSAEWDMSSKTWNDQKNKQFDQLKKDLQAQVDAGKVKAEDANKFIAAEAQKANQEYQELYKAFNSKSSKLQSMNIADQENLKRKGQLLQKQMSDLEKYSGISNEEFEKKYGMSKAKYQEKYQIVAEIAMTEMDILDKAEKKMLWDKMNYFEKVSTSTMNGFMGLSDAIFGGAKYFAPTLETPDFILSLNNETRGIMPNPNLGNFTAAQVLNPNWWIENVGNTAPLMLPGMAVGAGVTRGALSLMSKTGLTVAQRTAVASMVGGASSRFVEAPMEGFGAYTEALANGETYEEANRQFNEVVNGNLALMVIDAVQLYDVFKKAGRIEAAASMGRVAETIKTVATYGGKAALQITTGGAEEVYQEGLIAKAADPYMTWLKFLQSDAANEIFWIGGTMELGMSVGMGSFSDRSAIATINKQVKSYFDGFKAEDVSADDMKGRLMMLENTINTLEAQGVMSEAEIGDARQKMKHAYNMFTQAQEGILPFDFQSPQFDRYSALVYEADQLQRKADDLDLKGRRAEKEIVLEQKKNIEGQIDQLIKDPEEYSYSYNDIPMSKEDFESLALRPENKAAYDNGNFETDDVKLVEKISKVSAAEEAKLLVTAQQAVDTYVGEKIVGMSSGSARREMTSMKDENDLDLLQETKASLDQKLVAAEANIEAQKAGGNLVKAIQEKRNIEKQILAVNTLIERKAKEAKANAPMEVDSKLLGKVGIKPATTDAAEAIGGGPVQEQNGIPAEISNLNDNEVVTFKVASLEDVPEEFRDKARKVGGGKIETRQMIFGLPFGKKEIRTVPEAYVYSLTGKEAKDYAIQKQATVADVKEEGGGAAPESPVVISSDVKTALTDGKKKQIIEADEDGNPIVTEVEFTQDDADMELDYLEGLANKGKLTPEKFQSSFFGQSTDTVTLGEAKKMIEADPKGFIAKLRESFEGKAAPEVKPESVVTEKTSEFTIVEDKKKGRAILKDGEYVADDKGQVKWYDNEAEAKAELDKLKGVKPEKIEVFQLVENEGEWKATTKTYKGREIGNWVNSHLDKKQQKEYDDIRDAAETYGTKEQADKNLKRLKDFEEKNKEAFEKAKQEIDDFKQAEESAEIKRDQQQKIFDKTSQDLDKLSDADFEKLVGLIDEKRRKTIEQRFGDRVGRKPLFSNVISESYHQAKANGSNPELVAAVEKLLGVDVKPKDQKIEVDDKALTPELREAQKITMAAPVNLVGGPDDVRKKVMDARAFIESQGYSVGYEGRIFENVDQETKDALTPKVKSDQKGDFAISDKGGVIDTKKGLEIEGVEATTQNVEALDWGRNMGKDIMADLGKSAVYEENGKFYYNAYKLPDSIKSLDEAIAFANTARLGAGLGGVTYINPFINRKPTITDIKEPTKESAAKRTPSFFGVAPDSSGNWNNKATSTDNTADSNIEFFETGSDSAEFLPTSDPTKLDRMFDDHQNNIKPILEPIGISNKQITSKTIQEKLASGEWELVPGKAVRSGAGWKITKKAELVIKSKPTTPVVQPVAKEPTVESEGKRLSTFKKGDVVTKEINGKTKEYTIENTERSTWQLKNNETGQVTDFNPENNSGFNLKEPVAKEPIVEEKAEKKEKTEKKFVPGNYNEDLIEATTEPNTPIDVKKDIRRGYRVNDGKKFFRPEKIDEPVTGNETEIFFTPKMKVKGKYVILEADEVQQSHYKGEPNMHFFLGDAQPKLRKDKNYMSKAGQIKAMDLQSALATEGPIAYFGAPVVNERGELVQGTGRTEGIKVAYNEFPQSAAKYKQYLIDNAARFGLDPEVVKNMKNPILTRMIPVDDDQAIIYGNYNELDMIDVGGPRAQAIARVRRADQSKLRGAIDYLLKRSDPDDTMNASIRGAGEKFLDMLLNAGAISRQEALTGMVGGQITIDLTRTIEDMLRQVALEGAIPDLVSELNLLPVYIAEAFDRIVIPLISVNPDRRILDDIHLALIGVREYLYAAQVDAGLTFEQWLNKQETIMSIDIPAARYSPIQLALTKMLVDIEKLNPKANTKTKKIAAIFKIISEYQVMVEATSEGGQMDMMAAFGRPVPEINEALNKAFADNNLNLKIEDYEYVKGEGETSTNNAETEGITSGSEPTDYSGKPKEGEQLDAVSEKRGIVTDEEGLFENKGEKERLGFDNAVDMLNGMLAQGMDPMVAIQSVLDSLDNIGMHPDMIAKAKMDLMEATIRFNARRGISPDASKTEVEIESADSVDAVEKLEESHDAQVDEAELPTQLTPDIIKGMVKKGIITQDQAFFANQYLSNPNEFNKEIYEDALSLVGQYKEALKVKPKKKPAKTEPGTKKETPKKEAAPKTVKEKQADLAKKEAAALKELEALFGKIGDSKLNKASEVKFVDILMAAAKFAYYKIENFAVTHADNPELINKAEWKKAMIEAIGDRINPYLESIWNGPVPPSVDENTPILADHAEKLRKRAKDAIKTTESATATETTFEAEGPTTDKKQGRPVQDKREPNRRPPLSYHNYDKLPKEVDEFIPEERYGSDLDKHQRFAVNMMLTNWLTNGNRAFLLNDSMGVGKTRQIIAAAVEYAKRTGKPVLIVTENKTIIETAFIPDALAMGIDLGKAGVKLVTYDGLKKEVGNEFGLVVYDEAQNMKNNSGKYQASTEISTDNILFSTATPGDRIESSIYFMADLMGISHEEYAKLIGVVEGDKAGTKTWQRNGTVSQAEAATMIDEEIQKAYSDGMIVRREYPYWGTTTNDLVDLTPEQEAEIENITYAYDSMIDRVSPGTYYDKRTGEAKQTKGNRNNKNDKRYYGATSDAEKDLIDDKIKRELREQKINMLDKVIETYKVKAVMIRIKNDIASGKSVVVVSQYVNEIKVSGLTGELFSKTEEVRPSFLQGLKAELIANGIPFTEVTGTTDKTAAVQAFQNGEVNVIIGSIDSMSVGISLDDTTGNRPRTLYVAQASYDANKFSQVLGRVSRRNSATPAEAVIVYGKTTSETSKMGKVTRKTGILGLFQGQGIDPATQAEIDRMDEFEAVVEKKKEARKKAKEEKKKVKVETVTTPGMAGADFIVVKDSYDIKDFLKALGSKRFDNFNKGWPFPIERKAEIEALMDAYNAGTLDAAAQNDAIAKYNAENGTAKPGTHMASGTAPSSAGRPIRPLVSPITGMPVMKVADLILETRKRLGIFMKYGYPGSPKAIGSYKTINSAVTIKHPNDLDTIIHEAGHYIQDVKNLTPTDDRFDSELEQLWIWGSAPPDSLSAAEQQKYLRGEGIAEFTRAYILNPSEARRIAPTFYDFFESQMSDADLENLKFLSDAYRALAGLNAIDRITATEVTPEQVANSKRGNAARIRRWFDGFAVRWGLKYTNPSNFNLGFWDKLNVAFGDRLSPIEKAQKEAMRLKGQEDVNPSKNPYMLARLFAGIGEKIGNIQQKGWVRKTKNGYVRSVDVDPKTGVKSNITIAWMMEPLAMIRQLGKGFKNRMADIVDAQQLIGNYMVSQRTIELSKRFAAETILGHYEIDQDKLDKINAKLDNIDTIYPVGTPENKAAKNALLAKSKYTIDVINTINQLFDWVNNDYNLVPGGLKDHPLMRQIETRGITGIGLFGENDFIAAKKALDEINKQYTPEQIEVIKEGARRYQVFADQMLLYLMDHGRISPEQVNRIKKLNAQYVALQRLMDSEPGKGGDEINIVNKDASGRLSIDDAIKGSFRTRFNPYENLMSNMYKKIEESDANYNLNQFVDVLRNNRGMNEGSTTPTAQIGQQVDMSPDATADPDKYIVIYNEGVREVWEFTPEIHKALSSMYKSSQDSVEANTLFKLWGAYAKVVRFTVTKNPFFAFFRNVPRDVQSRAILSRTAVNPGIKKALREKGMTDAEIDLLMEAARLSRTEADSMLSLYGGGQSGYYLKSREHYYAEIYKQLRKMAEKGSGSIVVDIDKLKQMWESYDNWLASGERLTRVSEYQSAYKHAKTKLGYNDYDASLYAAYQARDLMDFAKMGATMKYVNQILPFSNANLQGTLRMFRAFKEDLPGTLAKWSAIQALPSLGFLALAIAGGYEDEYMELPAHERDLFFNFKLPGLSDQWIRIPKPFELGVLGTSVERLVQGMATGDMNKAFSGHSNSWSNAYSLFSPKKLLINSMGAAKPIIEASSNFNFFYNDTIINPWEESLPLSDRKGKRSGSYLGNIIMDGIGVDSRKVDHVIRSYFTFFGDMAIKSVEMLRPGKPEREDFDNALDYKVALNRYDAGKDKNQFISDESYETPGIGDDLLDLFTVTGIVKRVNPQGFASISYIKKISKDYGLSKTKDMDDIKNSINAYSGAETKSDRADIVDNIIERADYMRPIWIKNIAILDELNRNGKVEYLGIIYTDKEKTALKNKLFNN